MQEDFRKLASERKAHYLKHPDDESLLEFINARIEEKEADFIETYSASNSDFKNIFVVGAPRSGTTILTQVLATAFDLNYVNNFVARFYRAPLTGLWLEKQIFGEHRSEIEFMSDFARTSNIWDIHDFGYFWRNKLNIKNATDILDRERMVQGIPSVFRHLHAINAYNRSSMVFKNIYGGYVLADFLEHDENHFFVYIERDVLPACLSILDARRKHYEDITKWWSSYPFEFKSIVDLNVYEQIFHQVKYLQNYYDGCAQRFPDRVVKLKYENLVQESLESELSKVAGISGLPIARETLDKIHPRLKCRDRKNDSDDIEAFTCVIESSSGPPV